MRRLTRISAIVLILLSSLVSLLPIGQANATLTHRIIGYITWGNLSSNWSNGATLSSENSLNYLTDIVAPAVNPSTASSPSIVAMYGTLSNMSYVVSAGHAHGTTVAPYLYTDSSGNHGTTLSAIVSAGKQNTLASNIGSFLTTYNLDGIVVDCEDGSSTTTINTILNSLYSVLHPLGKFIDITGSPYSAPNVAIGSATYLRYVQVMSYDMWVWPDTSNGYPQASYTDYQNAFNMWVTAGWSKSQLIGGIPFYGRTSYNATLSPKQDSKNYSDIVDALNPSASTDYGTIGGRVYWWGGINTDIDKANYAVNNGYAGVMVFAVGYDELNSSKSLLMNIYSAMATPTPSLVSISVTPSSPGTLSVGSHQQFTATATYDDSSTSDVSSNVTWTSSNTTVATISTHGLVLGVAAGTTSITATNGVSSTPRTLTVAAIPEAPAVTLTSILITPGPSISGSITTHEQFTATGTYSNNTTATLTTLVTWNSSSSSIVSISTSGLSTTLVAGISNITVSYSGVTSNTVTYTVIETIIDPPNLVAPILAPIITETVAPPFVPTSSDGGLLFVSAAIVLAGVGVGYAVNRKNR